MFLGQAIYVLEPLHLDPCCSDRSALDGTADKLRAIGYTADKAGEQGMALLKFPLGLCAQVRGTDPAVSDQQANLAASGLVVTCNNK
jgi:hypothetical protein